MNNKNLATFVNTLLDRRNARREDEQLSALKHHFDSVLQVKEFNGALYIAVDGIPMMAATDIRQDTNLIEVLQACRTTAIVYHMRKKGGSR